jgi:Fur family ferric uptake transcriptional regulator
VRHFHVGHGPGLYGLARASESEYLVCESCRAVRAVELDDLRSLIQDRFGYQASFNHFPVIGLCGDCAHEGPATHDAEETSTS